MMPYSRMGPASPPHVVYVEPERHGFSRVCCCLLAILVLLVVALGATILALYFVFRPQAPQFSLDNVNVNDLIIVPDTTTPSSILSAANTTGNNPTLDGTSLPPIPSNPALSNDVSASIAALLRGNAAAAAAAPIPSGVNLTGLELGFRLNATINYTLEARNPNKVGIEYQAVNVSLSYRSVHVGDSKIPPFYQGAGNSTSVPASFEVRSFPLDSSTAPKMLADLQSDALPLTVDIVVQGKLNILGVSTPSVKVTLSCGITVQPTSGSVPQKSCVVKGVEVH